MARGAGGAGQRRTASKRTGSACGIERSLRTGSTTLRPVASGCSGAPDVDGRLLCSTGCGSRMSRRPTGMPVLPPWIVPVPHERAPSLLHWIEHRALLEARLRHGQRARLRTGCGALAAEVGPPVDATTEALQLKGRRPPLAVSRAILLRAVTPCRNQMHGAVTFRTE